MSVHVFGIRHHGPGSARSLLRALEALSPDALLIEGPPEADALIPLAAEPGMEPPVALLVYDPAELRRSVYYPFATFSPEWQAIKFALDRGVPVRFCDLPQAHQLGDDEEDAGEIRADPLEWLARAAGHDDGERWWEQLVEHRRADADLFPAVTEAMAAVRGELDLPEPLRERRREAYMRQQIRAAEREGFGRIAVVCGAWHAPALTAAVPARDDAALLKGLPRAKLAATWVPWTSGRLAMAGGYGAGVVSPGWYQHLWELRDADAEAVSVSWLARAARLLRDEDLPASTAQVIDAVRLAQSVAAMRGMALPGLAELNQAADAVFWGGGSLPLRLIHERLVVGERLGSVPESVPSVPLQQELAREQKRLRLAPEAAERTLELDLRRELDLERSRLLHRLRLLGIAWGDDQRVTGKKGTFHEHWKLRWEPDFAVRLIEASVWGSTVAEAAAARVRADADEAALPALTSSLQRVLLADLPDAARHLIARIDAEAASSSDPAHLMRALPPLAGVLRYGDVRGTDGTLLRHLTDGMVARIAIGLPLAVSSLDDDAAAALAVPINEVHGAVTLLQDPHHRELWTGALSQVAARDGVHGLIRGRAVRLLLDLGALTPDEAGTRMGIALSPAADPAGAGSWIEGFLGGSGLVILHDARLFGILDGWLAALPPDAFTQLLPLLRRTFATFQPAERRGIGERARSSGTPSPAKETRGIDTARAEAALPILAQLLGLQPEGA